MRDFTKQELDAARDMADKVMGLYQPFANQPSFVVISLIHAMTRVMSLLPPGNDEAMLDVVRDLIKSGLPVMRRIVNEHAKTLQ
jgi:hypothetical protein